MQVRILQAVRRTECPGVAQHGQSAPFGAVKSGVRISPPGPRLKRLLDFWVDGPGLRPRGELGQTPTGRVLSNSGQESLAPGIKLTRGRINSRRTAHGTRQSAERLVLVLVKVMQGLWTVNSAGLRTASKADRTRKGLGFDSSAVRHIPQERS